MMAVAAARRPRTRSLALRDFSGGLNTRDAATSLAANETPDALNMTLDELGAARTRDFCGLAVALPSTGTAYIFYSEALDKWFCNQNSAVYVRPGNLTGSWTDLTLSSLGAGAVAFVDFPGATPQVVMVNTTGGVYTYDGTTDTNRSTVVKGSCIALWQNKVWIGGYPTSDANGNPTTLFACKPGDPTEWVVANGALSVQLRTKDAAAVTALATVGTALLAFKARSAYRVTNAETGAYSEIDPSTGAVGPRATTTADGLVYVASPVGIYVFDGMAAGVAVTPQVVELEQSPPTVATNWKGRPLFAGNSALYELFPRHRRPDGTIAVMKHALAYASANDIASFGKKGETLYGALSDHASMLRLFSTFADYPPELLGCDYAPGSTPNPLAFSAYYTLPWLALEGGRLARIDRLEVEGFSGLAPPNDAVIASLAVRLDRDATVVATYSLTDWERTKLEEEVRKHTLRSLGHMRDVQFKVVFTGQTGTASDDVGSYGKLTAVALETVDLGQ